MIVKELVKNKIDSLFRRAELKLYKANLPLYSNLKLPDFLIIGAPKSATWWLAENLEAHPQIFLARGEKRGELHYFDENFHRTLFYYSNFFRQSSSFPIVGEKTPSYCTLPLGHIGYLRQLMPNVRIIMILRDPVERLWSDAMMMLIRKPNRIFGDLTEMEIMNYLLHRRYDILYTTVINCWTRIFPLEQIFWGFFEDVEQNPQGFLEQVFDFVGATSEIAWEQLPYNKVINKGSGVPIPDNLREVLEAWYRDEKKALYYLFPDKVRHWL